MLHRFLVIVGIALVVWSCSKTTTNPTDPVVEVKFDNTEYVKATIAGSTYSAQPSGPATVSYPVGMLFFTIVSPNSAGIMTISATVADTGKGTYTLATGGDGTMVFTSYETGVGVSFSTTNGATGTLMIDKIDLSLKRVKGRFSGTIKSDDGATKEVKDGTFEAKW